MSWNARARRFHRWLSMVFTLAVAANLVALALQRSAVWVGLLALFPLILLECTGLYLFFQPYRTNRRAKRQAESLQ